MRLNFGLDDLGEDQIFNLPSKKELLKYLQPRLSNLRRNPNICPTVQLTITAEMVYSLELLLFNTKSSPVENT